MRVCFVTAPTVAEFSSAQEISSSAVKQAASEPQLGILSLAAQLEARGDTPQIVDLNRAFLAYAHAGRETRPPEFAAFAAETVAECDTALFGFSSICSSYPLTIRIARILKALRPAAKILLGGPQASVVDLQTLAAFPFIDFVLRGEAEHSLPLLLKELEGPGIFCGVPGLTYRQGGQVLRNSNGSVIEDLDALPSPAYHLTGELLGSSKAALELGRGCPFACTFCSTNDFFRRNFRLRSPERVLRDMRQLAAQYSIRNFELVHDMFTVDRRRVVAFCEAMIASGENFTWSCSARTDRIDRELVDLMARAGCRGIFFGVEAGSERMQKVIDKHLDPQWAEQVIDVTERAGIGSTVSLITGFPEETWDDLKQSIRVFMHSARAPKSHPQLNLLAPLAGTPVYCEHKNELILEDLCSSVSRQSQTQDPADFQLIRAYPEIFPNFYAIPTRYLDRPCLLELREFALMGVTRFRWLLTAIDQNSQGMLDFFLDWRSHRLRTQPQLAGFALRHYYRTRAFQMQFLSFVRGQQAGRASAVRALLDFEDTVRSQLSRDDRTKPVGDPLAAESALLRRDRPVRKKGVVVIELGFDIQRIIEALKLQRQPVWERGRHYYVTREVSPGVDRLDRVSDWMAGLLRLCNGRRSIEEIVPRLSENLAGVHKALQEHVCMRLLAGAQNQSLIDIYRDVGRAKACARSRLAEQETAEASD